MPVAQEACGRHRRLAGGTGITALPYHAGLPAALRRHPPAAFLREDGVVMVATVAFGMGIDKPDVRFSPTWILPRSPEGFYQESGRAGHYAITSRPPAGCVMACRTWCSCSRCCSSPSRTGRAQTG